MNLRSVALVAVLAGGWPLAARAVHDPLRLPDPTRKWSVTLTTRGEFDDNINTAASNERSSFKAVAIPEVLVNLPTEQTFVGLRYSYRVDYAENRDPDPVDQTHQADLILSHTVNPRLQLGLNERLRRGIEPEIVDRIAGDPYVRRRRGDFLHNELGGSVSYNVSRRWNAQVRGSWSRWDYDEAVASVDDRHIYRGTLELVYGLDRRTDTGAGYQYTRVDFDRPGPQSARNADSHVGYVVLARRFTPQLSLSANAGAEWREFDDGTSASGPWVDTTLTYNYGPQSAVRGGMRYSISTSDIASYRVNDAFDIFGRVSHRLTAKASASVEATFSWETFSKPFNPLVQDEIEEEGVSVVGSLRYRFTNWFSGDVGYIFTHVWSDVDTREYTRNRVYLGGRVQY